MFQLTGVTTHHYPLSCFLAYKWVVYLRIMVIWCSTTSCHTHVKAVSKLQYSRCSEVHFIAPCAAVTAVRYILAAFFCQVGMLGNERPPFPEIRELAANTCQLGVLGVWARAEGVRWLGLSLFICPIVCQCTVHMITDVHVQGVISENSSGTGLAGWFDVRSTGMHVPLCSTETS